MLCWVLWIIKNKSYVVFALKKLNSLAGKIKLNTYWRTIEGKTDWGVMTVWAGIMTRKIKSG